ncbi:MAG: AI-2E family transporter, partial [Candidatus Pacebacteria bacterium]|nr:AI-2E family transporter [Candidatus Paceibacterota bacterium]
MSEPNKIEISTGTILRVMLLLLASWFLYVVRDIILLLFISVIIVAAINPVVSWINRKWKVSRTIGALFVFAIIVALVVLAVSFIVPPVITQFHEFSKNAAQYYSGAENWLGRTGLTSLAGNNVGTLSGLSGNIF